MIMHDPQAVPAVRHVRERASVRHPDLDVVRVVDGTAVVPLLIEPRLLGPLHVHDREPFAAAAT